MKKRVARWAIFSAILVGLTTGGYVAVSSGLAQEQEAQRQGPGKAGKMMMCPMMAAFEGLEVYVDAPPLLLADAEALNLTSEQKQQLQEIIETTRQQARQVLNEEQLAKLNELPQEALTPMQLAMLRMKSAGLVEQGGEHAGKMCPMCMQMMQKMQAGGQAGGAQPDKAQQEHDHEHGAGTRSTKAGR